MSSKNVIDLRGGKPRKATVPERSRETSRPVVVPTRRDLRRASPVRARRRKIRLVLGIILVLIAGVVAFGISYVSYLPKYSINSITIDGAHTIPTSLIGSFIESQIFNGTHPYLSQHNIFLYHRVGLQNQLVGDFPRIKSAAISRDSLLSTTLHVVIVEREPFAKWCQSTNVCFQMDPSGYVFAEAPESTTTVSYTTTYSFMGGLGTSTNPIASTFVGAHMPGIIALLKQLTQAGYQPTGATVVSDQDFVVHLTDGFDIKASFGEDSMTLVHNLQLILGSDALTGKEAQIQYIDLRFGDRVYYKLIGGDEATSTSSH